MHFTRRLIESEDRGHGYKRDGEKSQFTCAPQSRVEESDLDSSSEILDPGRKMKTHFALSLAVAAAILSLGTAAILGDVSSGNECIANRGECVDWYKEAPSGTTISGNIFTHGCTDIVVLLDCSDAVGELKFSEGKEFIKKLITAFKFGPKGSRIAIITYSESGTTMVIDFLQSTTKSKPDMLNEIDTLTFHAGPKKTLEGLKQMKEEFQKHARGLGNKNRAGIMISDGTDEPPPPAEAQVIDLCFVIDVTGSMSDAIANVKAEIGTLVSDLLAAFPDMDLQIAVSAYRDDGDTYPQFDFSPVLADAQAFVDGLSAEGGGDGPEDVEGALNNAGDFTWRVNATKVCVLIVDAPGHGEIWNAGDDKIPGITNALFELKCNIGVDAFQVLKIGSSTMESEMNQYFDAMELIARQKCGATDFLPGMDNWFTQALIGASDVIVTIKALTEATVKEISYTEITKQLCDMKVDLLGLAMAIGGDYATLEIILKESLHKRISLTNPLVVRPADTDVDFAVAAIIDLIKEGSDICACNVCNKGSKCLELEPGVFECKCKAGFSGSECEEPPCPKCRTEAIIQFLSDPTCFVPVCTPDGSFRCAQYHEFKNESFCVNPAGVEVPETRVSGTEIDCSEHCKTGPAANPCEAKRLRAIASRDPFIPVCDKDGYFGEVQCYGATDALKMCWCTQANGQLIPGSFHPAPGKPDLCKDLLAGKPDCSKAGPHGFMRHPFDCSMYWRCTPEMVYACHCPEGQFFNHEKCYCEWKKDVDCKAPEPDTPTPEPPKPFSPNDL